LVDQQFATDQLPSDLGGARLLNRETSGIPATSHQP
jgi:hypothetical protein